MIIRTPPTLWCDVDGVLAIYEPHIYRSEDPPYKKPGIHYFKSCKPDHRMLQALYLISRQLPTYVVTNIATDVSSVVQKEHQEDKHHWLATHLTFLEKQQYNTIQETKAAYASNILDRHLTSTDILISDYNIDLYHWTASGGSGVKYLNHINSEGSYHGPHIALHMTPDEIKDFICSLIL